MSAPTRRRVYEYDSVYRVSRVTAQVAANDPVLLNVVANDSTNADVIGVIGQQQTASLFDGVGNRVSVESIIGRQSSATGYQVNAINEYSRIGATPRSHDNNGNLRADGSRTLHYDARNRLVRVATLGDNTIAAYKYDALGQRIEKRAGAETVRYIHFGKQIIEEHAAPSIDRN